MNPELNVLLYDREFKTLNFSQMKNTMEETDTEPSEKSYPGME